MLIAQITDMHIKAEGTLVFGHVDTCAYLARAVEHLNRRDPRPDAVLVTGDMTNDGTPEDCAALARLLGRLEMPYYLVPGNHDTRANLRAAFPDLAYLPGEGHMRYVVEHHAVRLVALDSLVEGHHHGEIGGAQLDWLAGTLAAAPDRPTIVFFHQPPFATGIERMDGSRLTDADALGAVIARHPQVERVLCGHLHRPITRRFAGTVVQTAPATAHQVMLNLGEGKPLRWVMEPPAVMLHLWRAGDGLVSHVEPVGDYGQPQPFTHHHTRAAPAGQPAVARVS